MCWQSFAIGGAVCSAITALVVSNLKREHVDKVQEVAIATLKECAGIALNKLSAVPVRR